MNNAAVNKFLLEQLFSVVLGIVELLGHVVWLSFVFKFLRSCQTIDHGGRTILHSHREWTRVPVSPRLHQHLFFFLLLIAASGCEVVSHRGFSSYFPNG